MDPGEGGAAPFDHARAFELLPWLVNGTLAEPERAGVERHVERCSLCRDEIDFHRDAQAAARWTRDGAWEPPPGHLEGLLQRLPPQPSAGAARSRDGWRALPARVRWVVAAQAALAAGLAGLLLWQAGPSRPERYETLSSPGAAISATGPQLQIAFAETTTERELRDLLLANGVSIVQGPSPRGIYSASLEAGSPVENVVATLRSDPRVRFVEPLGEPRP